MTFLSPAGTDACPVSFVQTEEDFETSSDVKIVKSFNDMGLREDLLKGIYQYGAESLSLPYPFPA